MSRGTRQLIVRASAEFPSGLTFGVPRPPGAVARERSYANRPLHPDRGAILTLRHSFETVDSTQAIALQWAREGAPEGTVVVAGSQSNGHGRVDHGWSSPPGGLYLSLVLGEPSRAFSLAPLAFGLAVIETVETYGAHPRLKWPNDVVTVDADERLRKLAGVIVDRVDSPTLGHALVAGVGVNVGADRSSFAGEVSSQVVQVNELVSPPRSVGAVEADLTPRLRAANEMLRTRGGQLNTVARCRQALYGLGRAARLDGRAIGTLQSLDEDGSLWVTEDGLRRNVRAGDLEVIAG